MCVGARARVCVCVCVCVLAIDLLGHTDSCVVEIFPFATRKDHVVEGYAAESSFLLEGNAHMFYTNQTYQIPGPCSSFTKCDKESIFEMTSAAGNCIPRINMTCRETCNLL